MGLRQIEPLHVATYIRSRRTAKPTVNQHLAAIRTLCNWLVVHQVIRQNPAAAVKGPRQSSTRGSTPVLTREEMRRLLDAIDGATLVGTRDLAFISTMLYSFARVSAVAGMRVLDYYMHGSQPWLRLQEKGGKRHDIPAHHKAAQALDRYIQTGGLQDPLAPLFQSVGPRGAALTGKPLVAPARALHGETPSRGRRPAVGNLLPQLPGHRHHDLSGERRQHRGGATNRRPPVAPDHEALRPEPRHGDDHGDREDRDLTRRGPDAAPANPGSTGWTLNPRDKDQRGPGRCDPEQGQPSNAPARRATIARTTRTVSRPGANQ